MKRIYQFYVDVTRIIDGDTFVGDADLGMDVKRTNQHFRLIDIDTPERNEEGFQEATDYTKELIDGKRVLVESYGTDSFGRWLVDVHVKGERHTLNYLLLLKELAVVF